MCLEQQIQDHVTLKTVMMLKFQIYITGINYILQYTIENLIIFDNIIVFVSMFSYAHQDYMHACSLGEHMRILSKMTPNFWMV